MLEEFNLVDHSIVSFMREVYFDIVLHVNGQRQNVLSETLDSFDLDHVWIQYLISNVLWGVSKGGVGFGRFDESFL